LNSGPLGYQPSAPTKLSYEPFFELPIWLFISYNTYYSYNNLSFIVSKQKGIYLKEYDLESGIMAAVCDMELVGKSFRGGDLYLKITESFYKGKEATEREVVGSLKHATIANLVGKRAIKCALDNNFIEEANVIFVDGVPHAQVVKL
jgi:hypothetical protein